MISVEQAERLITERLTLAPTQSLPLEEAQGQILREDLIADRPYPPFHRVAMDGIAIQYSAWELGLREFEIRGIQKAGQAAFSLQQMSECYEVMTGAVLPQGADMVIRYEDLEIKDGQARVIADVKAESMLNIHQMAMDYHQNDLLLSPAIFLDATHISIAASIGKSDLKVSQRPRIAVISTGDELVELEEEPTDFQVRRSNPYALQAALFQQGFKETDLFHLQDHRKEIFDGLALILKSFDWVIISGGVSAGKFDFLPEVLGDLKVEKVFHQVAQRPGKPMWFGQGQKNQMVFGLPGNPVSSLTCLHRYVLPALWRHLGMKPVSGKASAVLQQKIEFSKPLTYFYPVRLQWGEQGRLEAIPVQNNGSGDFASLARSEGFIELPSEGSVYPAGQAYPLTLWSGVRL